MKAGDICGRQKCSNQFALERLADAPMRREMKVCKGYNYITYATNQILMAREQLHWPLLL